MQQPVGPGFRIEALVDGNVLFAVVDGGRDVVSGVLTGQEAGQMATALLTQCVEAFANTGKSAPPVPTQFQAISNIRFSLGGNSTTGRLTVIIQAGEATVGLAVDIASVRDLARGLIRMAYHPQFSPPTFTLLRDLFADFFAGLRGWGGVFSARLKAASRPRAISFSSWISGRSLRICRTIDLSPNADLPGYAPIKSCIYCDATVYSEEPEVRRAPLGAEHIIPEGLDGKLELPEASCRRCEAATARLERDVLLRTMKAVRLYLQIKGKRRSSRPRTLPLTDSTGGDGKDRIVQIPVEDYPVAFNMPLMGAPGVFTGGPGGSQPFTGFTMIPFRLDHRVLRLKYGIKSFALPVWDTHMLLRMLAKIGHAFAVAELGLSQFKPLLCDVIRTQAEDAFNCIGGEPHIERRSTALHELGLGYQRANGKDYVVARVRLFAGHYGPTYYVVVGESLETPIAKFKRVFSRRISRMLAR
jgi:hypothetical protein